MNDDPIDWKAVAVKVFRADGACYLLSTPERDALEAADAAAGEPTADDRVIAGLAGLLRDIRDTGR